MGAAFEFTPDKALNAAVKLGPAFGRQSLDAEADEVGRDLLLAFRTEGVEILDAHCASVGHRGHARKPGADGSDTSDTLF